MIDKKYCRKCGRELKMSVVYADQVNVWYQDGMGGSLAVLDSAYNQETGQHNMAEEFYCSKWKKYFNNHDKIIKYRGEYHYL